MRFISKYPGHYLIARQSSASANFAEIRLETMDERGVEATRAGQWQGAVTRGIERALSTLCEMGVDKVHGGVSVREFRGLRVDTSDNDAETCAYMATISLAIAFPGLLRDVDEGFTVIWPTDRPPESVD